MHAYFLSSFLFAVKHMRSIKQSHAVVTSMALHTVDTGYAIISLIMSGKKIYP